MAKRKKKSTPKSGVLVYFGILISILAIVGIVYLVASSKKDKSQISNTKTIESIDRYFESKKRDYTILDISANTEQNTTQTKPDIEIKNESRDDNISQNLDNKPSKNEKPKTAAIENKLDSNLNINRPKLVIILDDISTLYHAKKIKSLDMNITPSIFPVSKNYPNSVKTAAKFEFYMIHLPLEAMRYMAEEINTLKVGDSRAKIESQIAKIKSDFPAAIYINNHTGSKFTSDYNSMKTLFEVLKKYNMIFIDSYTTKDSKAGILSKEFGNKYIKRDVFIDNIRDEKSITKELRRAIKIAKTTGWAVVIGHPYRQTFAALEAMKDEIKSQTTPIFLRDFYEIYN